MPKLKPNQVIHLEKLNLLALINTTDLNKISDFTDNGIQNKARLLWNYNKDNLKKMNKIADRWNDLSDGEPDYPTTLAV